MSFRKILQSNVPPSVILIRLIVGGVFLSEGIQKFLFPNDLGVGRFMKIGILAPQIIAPFVGVVEIVCGALIILGLLTRLAAIPLIIDISVAILSTKIPILLGHGFWQRQPSMNQKEGSDEEFERQTQFGRRCARHRDPCGTSRGRCELQIESDSSGG